MYEVPCLNSVGARVENRERGDRGAKSAPEEPRRETERDTHNTPFYARAPPRLRPDTQSLGGPPVPELRLSGSPCPTARGWGQGGEVQGDSQGGGPRQGRGHGGGSLPRVSSGPPRGEERACGEGKARRIPGFGGPLQGKVGTGRGCGAPARVASELILSNWRRALLNVFFR